MNDEIEKVIEKDRKRYILLKTLYEISEGDTYKLFQASDFSRKADLSDADLKVVIRYLSEEKLILQRSLIPQYSITHAGVVEVEQSIKNPNKATAHFSVAVLQQFFIGEVANITNPGGISQSISGGNVGSVQASQGDNNSQQAEINITQTSGETQLTQKDVIKLLTAIEQMLQASELSADVKEEATTYLNAAKKASEKEAPKKNVVAINLKGMAETLEDASKATDSARKIWETIKPILSQLPIWLGVAKTFFGF